MNRGTYSARDLEAVSRLNKYQAVEFIRIYGNTKNPRHKYISAYKFHELYSMGYVDAFIKGWKYDDKRVSVEGSEDDESEAECGADDTPCA